MIDAEGKSVGILFDTTPAYLTHKEMHGFDRNMIHEKYSKAVEKYERR